MGEDKGKAEYLLRLPQVLKDAAKKRAASRDLSLAQYVRSLIRDDLEPRT